MTLAPLCPKCRHEVELHRSTGCLYGLGRCNCPDDLRPADERSS